MSGISSPYARKFRKVESDPSAPKCGDVIVNEADEVLRVCLADGVWSDVSTGGGGASYLVYRATLTQSGTSAPVATVGENSLGGTLVWSRAGAGNYRATLAGAFPTPSKVILLCGSIGSNADFGLPSFTRYDTNTLSLITQDVDLAGASIGASDGVLSDTAITILIYP